MRTLSLRKFAVLVPLIAACGADRDLTSVGTALRSEGTLHDFCPGEKIPVWSGGGNPASATQIGTLELGGGSATLRLFDGQFSLAPTALHLQFADTLAGIPVTLTGNPVPGLFACQIEITPVSGQTVYTLDLGGCPVADVNGDGIVLAAAHFGISHPGGVGSVGDFYLPTSPVSVTVTHDGVEAPAYFPSIVISGAGALDGTFSGWCADPNRWMASGPAMLYSTYDSAAMAQLAAQLDPPTTFFADRLPMANYVVNRYVLGTPIPPMDAACNPDPNWATGAGNMWSIQQALWYVLADRPLEANDPWAQAIVCDALANGAAFVPACTQLVLLLAVPVSADGLIAGQPVLVQVPIPCGAADETAWADGLDGRSFPGAKQWGTYFQYDLSCGP